MTKSGPFDDEEPEADWTDDYDWTRYRGPQPYPVPEDWVLNIVEAGGAMFRRYPEIGNDHETDSEASEHFAPDYEGLEEARGIEASVGTKYIDEEEVETLTVAGEEVFQRVSPTTEDLYKTVAEALTRAATGEEYADIEPSTGSPPAAVRREQEIERRKSENHGLGQY